MKYWVYEVYEVHEVHDRLYRLHRLRRPRLGPMTHLPLFYALLLAAPYRSLIYSYSLPTSPSSHDTSSIKSITLSPFSLFLTSKTSYISKSFTRGVEFPISILWPLLLIIPKVYLSSLFICHNYVVLKILSLGEIMLSCSHYAEKRLVYIIIALPTGCQPLSYAKCIKANMCSLYNIHFAFNAKYMLFISLYNFLVPCSIYYKVLCSDGR